MNERKLIEMKETPRKPMDDRDGKIFKKEITWVEILGLFLMFGIVFGLFAGALIN